MVNVSEIEQKLLSKAANLGHSHSRNTGFPNSFLSLLIAAMESTNYLPAEHISPPGQAILIVS